MWEEPFSFWRNAGMGGYPGLRSAKICLFSYRCITNGVRGPIVAKLCADVTVTWIRTEKLLGGVISHKACTSRATSGFWPWERGAASSKGFRSHIMINTMGDLETSRPFSMLEILADQAIMRGRSRQKISPEFAALRDTSDSGANPRIMVAGEPAAAGRGFMACCEASRISSMRPRTLNLESSEETWNLTVRAERFSS